MALTLNSEAVSHARRLIAEGKIDHGPWDGQSAARNAETCLAHDESKKGTADEWKYPVISGGHVNVKGVASAAGYASAEGADAIAGVAHRLSNEIHGKIHGHAMSGDPIILHGAKLTAPKTLPLVLEGKPATVNGLPAHYVRKEVARVGRWTHRGDGSVIDITPQRADQWVDAFNKRLANGYRPFIPGQHRATFNAADNHGYVIDLKREGESLFTTMQLIGDDALSLAAKNDVSIYVIPDALDAKGNRYPEALEHVALTPNPALPDLQPFVKIAASADTPARDVPVYELSANPTPAPSRKESHMTPELAKQFREKLGIAADVPDDKLPDLAAQKAIALSADVSKLTGERDAAKADATAKAAEALALSADSKEPDALSLSLISRAFKSERDQVIASGVISQAGMDELDKLLIANGKPTRFALSLSAGSQDPFYMRICDILKRFPGVKTNNKLPADATEATPNPALAASGDGKEPAKPPTLARMNELRAAHHMEPWTKEQYESRLAGVK